MDSISAYYHPSNYSNLSVFVSHPKSTDGTLAGFQLEDIDLYHQPVLEPSHAFILFCVRASLVVVGGYIQVKVYLKTKRDDSLLKENAQLYAINHLILWPTWLVLLTTTDFIHPVNEVFGQWFCTLGSFMFYLGGLIMAFHSLVAAIMRYLFVVHEEKIKEMGIKKAKRIFLVISVLIPLIVALWHLLDAPEINAMHFITKCNGNAHKSFLVETSSLNVLKRNFCTYENESATQNSGYILQQVRRLSCIGRIMATLFIGFNFVEAFLYYKIVYHLKREHKEMMEKLKNILTESTKRTRTKRHLINIHVTILAWLVEFLGFFIVFVGHYVIGHNKNYIIQFLELACYCIILPYVYLINDTEEKMKIADSGWYQLVLELFKCKMDVGNERRNPIKMQ